MDVMLPEGRFCTPIVTVSVLNGLKPALSAPTKPSMRSVPFAAENIGTHIELDPSRIVVVNPN